jgi:hypothetical protein
VECRPRIRLHLAFIFIWRSSSVEFAARGLVAGAAYTMIVDGREVARVNADERGRIAVEFDVPLPRAPSSR